MESKPIQLLLVEDEESHAELVCRVFASQSDWAHLTVARSLGEARACIAAEKPDLVITDLRLPDGIGTELLAAGREELAYPVVIMTGHGAEQIAVEALKAGALDYVVKSATTLLDMPHVAERALREWGHLTQRKQAEEALQALSRQLLQIQENERHHIARELHEEICQSLSVLKIYVQNAQETPNAAILTTSLTQSLTIIDRMLVQVRDLSLGLRPSLLDDLGLIDAIQWYLKRHIQPTEIEVQLLATRIEPRPIPEVEISCFRVAQEALTNVLQHAQASHLRVEIRPDRNDQRLHLLIQDNGLGFDVASVKEQAIRGASAGLLSMQERVQLVGGTLTIKSIAQHGTTIHACFPLS